MEKQENQATRTRSGDPDKQMVQAERYFIRKLLYAKAKEDQIEGLNGQIWSDKTHYKDLAKAIDLHFADKAVNATTSTLQRICYILDTDKEENNNIILNTSSWQQVDAIYAYLLGKPHAGRRDMIIKEITEFSNWYPRDNQIQQLYAAIEAQKRAALEQKSPETRRWKIIAAVLAGALALFLLFQYVVIPVSHRIPPPPEYRPGSSGATLPDSGDSVFTLQAFFRGKDVPIWDSTEFVFKKIAGHADSFTVLIRHFFSGDKFNSQLSGTAKKHGTILQIQLYDTPFTIQINAYVHTESALWYQRSFQGKVLGLSAQETDYGARKITSRLILFAPKSLVNKSVRDRAGWYITHIPDSWIWKMENKFENFLLDNNKQDWPWYR